MSALCSPAIAAVRAPITVLPRMVQPAAFNSWNPNAVLSARLSSKRAFHAEPMENPAPAASDAMLR